MMSNAIGIIEVKGYVNAAKAYDSTVHFANLELIYMERNLGRFLVSMVLHGSLSDVQTALEGARERLSQEGSFTCIGNPEPQLMACIKALAQKSKQPDDGGVA